MNAGIPAWLDPFDPDSPFPDVEQALREPDGFLAIGGDLSPRRLLRAYRLGIFPWYSAGQPILWWSPDPRCVLHPAAIKVSRSLRRTLARGQYRVTMDRAFGAVMHACAEPRRDGTGTWITREMMAAYQDLHELGYAHSIEAWEGDQLVGGLYGVAVGRVFFGESMFARRTDASKVALVTLVRQLDAWGFPLIDCQVHSSHLESLGAVRLTRREFTALLNRWCQAPAVPGPWHLTPQTGHG